MVVPLLIRHTLQATEIVVVVWMPECVCGAVCPSMDAFHDHLYDEHSELLDGVVNAMLVGDEG
jgi:hypothetical protein